jgi:hypothetical protein
MTLLVGDGDDSKSHSIVICQWTTSNRSVEKGKADVGHISDCKIEGLLPTTFCMTLRPDEVCAEYITRHCESDTCLDDEDLDEESEHDGGDDRYLSIGMA